jgi:hypothetical protein
MLCIPTLWVGTRRDKAFGLNLTPMSSVVPLPTGEIYTIGEAESDKIVPDFKFILESGIAVV